MATMSRRFLATVFAIAVASVTIGPGTSVHRDQAAPSMPWVWSTSHGKGFPSPCRRVLAEWRPSEDELSGVAGYSWSFSRSRLDHTDASIEARSPSIRSPRLGDGRWWLHVRAVDHAGNVSTNAAIGPYWIDGRAIVLPGAHYPRRCETPTRPDAPRFDPESCLEAPRPDGYESSWRDGYQDAFGYEGLYYSPLTCTNRVRILRHTVTTTRSGRWRAWGLVRNETLRDVGTVTIDAALYGRSDELLGRVKATVPVTPLRRNEPGPFTLDSDLPAGRVARVVWAVSSAPSSGESRLLDVTFWREGWGDRGVRLQGEVHNQGRIPVHKPTIVGAWADSAGRIIWIETAEAIVSGGGSRVANLLPERSARVELAIAHLGNEVRDSFYWVTGTSR